jgi:hypothetical protein
MEPNNFSYRLSLKPLVKRQPAPEARGQQSLSLLRGKHVKRDPLGPQLIGYYGAACGNQHSAARPADPKRQNMVRIPRIIDHQQGSPLMEKTTQMCGGRLHGGRFVVEVA